MKTFRGVRKMLGQDRSHGSQRGFGLIEVVIAAGIISVLALGISTLISDMFRMQKKANAIGAITQMRNTITTAVQNGESWKRTADHAENTLMTCMRVTGASNCTEVAAPGTLLNLKDAAGATVFDALTAANGFRADGGACSTYPSEACPFRWDLRYILTCPGAAAVTTCMTPSVRVNATLVYSAPADPLPGGFNPANYSISILRGSESIRNDPVVVLYQEADDSGEAGSCKGAGWTQRMLNRVIADPGNNLLNRNAATAPPAALTTLNLIVLRSGTYTCRVQVPTFKSGGNRVRLRPTAGTMFPPIVSSVGVAGLNGGSAVMSIETTLVLTQDTTMLVEHTCTSNYTDAVPPGFGWQATNGNDYTLGAPVNAGGGYGSVIYSTVSCTRTS